MVVPPELFVDYTVSVCLGLVGIPIKSVQVSVVASSVPRKKIRKIAHLISSIHIWLLDPHDLPPSPLEPPSTVYISHLVHVSVLRAEVFPVVVGEGVASEATLVAGHVKNVVLLKIDL